jgi:hypothetical protein
MVFHQANANFTGIGVDDDFGCHNFSGKRNADPDLGL